MARDFAHPFREQFLSWRKLVPGRRAGWMRQRDKIDNRSGAANSKFAADDFLEFVARNKLGDSEPADRDDETRPQNFELFVHPARAVTNFIRRRNAIAAGRSFTRKTPTYRREVDC